jgi:hypothetical protein
MADDTPKLDYGTYGEPPGHRIERFTFWSALALAVLFFTAVFSLLCSAVSLLAAAAVLAGIFLAIRSAADPTFSAWYGVGGVALIVAGAAVLWLMHRYDLD